MKKLLIILCLFLLCASALFAQQKWQLSGMVRDAKTELPIEMATIVAQSAVSKRVLGYTNANEQGQYALALPYDSAGYIVTARFIGYAKQEQRLPFSSAKSATLHFSLQPEEVSLHEVVIEAKELSIRFSNDTTAYKVEAFMDGSEQTVEDLLKKLPGITVGESGVIYFKGKQVSAVMLDGDNLLGNNYTAATRSARADLVNEVHAIENYNDNPLLKSIEGGKGAILDLRIKEDRKKAAFGNIVAYYGLRHAREIQLNVFSFLKKSKTYLQGGHNNIGKENTPPIELNASLDEIDEQIEEMGLQDIPSLINNDLLVRTRLKDNRANLNNEWVGSLSSVISFTEKTKLTARLMRLGDRNTRGFQAQNTYLLQTPVIFSTIQDLQAQTNRWKGETELRYTGKEDFVVYRSEYQIGKTNWGGQMLFDNVSDIESVQEQMREQKQYIWQSLAYTHKFAENKAVVLRGNYVWVDAPQNYGAISDSSRYSPIFNLPLGYAQIGQDVDYGKHAATLTARMPIKLGSSLYQAKAGVKIMGEQLLSQAQVYAQEGAKVFTPDGFANDFQRLQQQYYVGSSYGYQKKWFEMKAQVYANYARQALKHGQDTAFFYFTPELSATARMGKWKKLTLSYKYGIDLPDASSLYGEAIFTGFRTAQRGLAYIWPNGNSSYSASFAHNNRNRSEYYVASISYMRQTNRYRSIVEASVLLQQLGTFIQPSADAMRYMLGYSRYFDEIGLNFDANVSLIQTNQQNKVNGIERNNGIYNVVYKAGIGTSLGKYMSFGGGGRIYHNLLVSKFANTKSQSSNTYFEGFFNLVGRYKANSVKLSADTQVLDKQLFSFIDVLFTFPVSKRTTLYAKGSNLTNMQAYRQVYLLDYMSYTSSIRLIPRLLMLGVNLNF